MKQQAKRPAFTAKQVERIITELRDFEKTVLKQRTCNIRALLSDYVNCLFYTGCHPGNELRYAVFSEALSIAVT